MVQVNLLFDYIASLLASNVFCSIKWFKLASTESNNCLSQDNL